MANNNFLRKPKKKNYYYYFIVTLIYLALCLGVCMIIHSYSLEHELKENIFDNLFAAFGWAVKLPNAEVLFRTEYIKPSLKFLKELWAFHLVVGLILIYNLTLPPPSEWKNMEYASGRMARGSEKMHYADKSGGKDGAIPIAKDFYIPVKTHLYKPHKWSKGIMQYSPQNLNQVVFAGSGAGKTLRQVMPQIMALTGNYIIVDPKQEILKSSYKYFNKNGYDIRVLNFYDIKLSDGYNPMAYVHNEQDILKLSELFMKSASPDGKSDFWSDSARLIFSAIMLYLYNSPSEEKSFGRALRLLSSLKVTEGEGIDADCEYYQRMTEYCSEDAHIGDMAYIYWQDLQGTPAVTLGGQLSTLKVRMALFYTADVANLTSADDMKLWDFAQEGKKIVLFVCLPPADSTYNALTTLFFAQLISELQFVCNQSATGKLPTLLNVICDEFANINKIDDWLKFISVNRSLNCRIVHILQNLQQLKTIYKEDYETLISNCSIFTALGSQDQSTLKLICDSIGKMNVKVQTQNYNFGSHSQGGGTKNNSIIGRDIQPNELKEFFGVRKNSGGVVYNKNCIVFIDLEFAYALEKYDTLNDRVYLDEFGAPFNDQVKNLTDIGTAFAGKKALKEMRLKEKQEQEVEKKKEQIRLAEEKARKAQEEESQKQEKQMQELTTAIEMFVEDGEDVSPQDLAELQLALDETEIDEGFKELAKGYSQVSAFEEDFDEDFEEDANDRIVDAEKILHAENIKRDEIAKAEDIHSLSFDLDLEDIEELNDMNDMLKGVTH